MHTSIDPVDITLASSGDGWMGTFGLVVKTLAEDILSDGEPFPARLTWETDDGSLTTQEVKITEVQDWVIQVEYAGGLGNVNLTAAIDIEAIRKLEA